MTVGTTAVEVEIGVGPVPQPVSAIVTLVAKSRHSHFQQALVNGTVRIMAVGTIIEDRRMLKEKRASSLCMTSVTVLVHTGLYEL
jgi:hypothetical protein